MVHYILDRDFDSILLQLLLVFIAWLMVIFSVGIDLHFGIKKSKKEGVYTHSYGLRKTSEKVVEYLAFMFFMLFLDVLNPLFAYFNITALPLMSVFGAIVLVYTEWKSVREKSDEKFRYALKRNPAELIKFVQENRELIEEIKKLKEK
ncbi:holin [Myroides sp. LoEW2-1]|uniref:holin n=1 Tax=Myroides sp. LoEW2-1 TaxID=2683192 RepID=UPI00132792A0|nr:holin [Myroides sp. LoEW2-1]MVX36223.1 holin [Myroides sp. LoEW2-1]